jgi:maltooligosyltrehalose trehalohydrolase
MDLNGNAGFAQKLSPARRRRRKNENLFACGQASSRNARSVSRYVKHPASGKALSTAGMLGASIEGEFCEFRVWAPNSKRVILRLIGQQQPRDLPMQRRGAEHFATRTKARAGDRYFYLVDDSKPVPDPVSRLLPEGVHGPTEIVDPEAFTWTDHGWRGLPLKDYVIYELHLGTFTPSGTFEAAIERLPYLRQLGVSAIELMPVAAFPGTRNWGYDGVSPYAVQASYGGPEGFRRLVDAAHAAGLGVVLDVVYNHLGNEGNYLRLFGPYFTDKHKTPWGEAVNYDQECCQGVRDYVIQNALYWIREYHVDGLRLDAVQTILDDSSPHILAELKNNVAALAKERSREVCVIAETDRNEAKLVLAQAQGGYGLDGLWSDDFHHAVQAFFTGERAGYYQDFGRPEQIVRALNEGFVFQGEPFSFCNGAPRGTPSRNLPAEAHVICVQNHDQVGNRPGGERWTVPSQFPLGARMLCSALLLLSPHTPLLFMGEEYDEINPFLFFTDYGDPALRKAVREGRRNEFRGFGHNAAMVYDPQDPKTFERSKLNWQRPEGDNKMLSWHKSLLELRRRHVTAFKRTCKADLKEGVLHLQVPATLPTLQIFARLEGKAALPAPGPGWVQAMAHTEDENAVVIYSRSPGVQGR